MNLLVATACMTHTITPPSLMMTSPHPVVAIHAARVAAPHTQHVAEVGEILFASTLNVAFIQPPGLGAPKASQANPGGAGNAEGNWWTPSNVSPNDLEGKVAEIKARQAINEQNGAYKLEKLKAAEKKAAEKKAVAAEREAEMKAKQAKFANKR